MRKTFWKRELPKVLLQMFMTLSGRLRICPQCLALLNNELYGSKDVDKSLIKYIEWSWIDQLLIKLGPNLLFSDHKLVLRTSLLSCFGMACIKFWARKRMRCKDTAFFFQILQKSPTLDKTTSEWPKLHFHIWTKPKAEYGSRSQILKFS